ncbi:hypothetical protein ACOSQ4_004661 [Xanthoceras sorbifolium]
MGFHFRFSYGGMKSSSSYLALPWYFNDHCPPVSSCCEVQKRIPVKAHILHVQISFIDHWAGESE